MASHSRVTAATSKSKISKASSGSTINNGMKKASPIYVPRNATTINHQRSTDKSSSPQGNHNMKVPSSAANDTNLSMNVENARSEPPKSEGSDWLPLMDGIISENEVQRFVDYVNDALYGPGKWRTLPIFEEFCRAKI